MAASGAVGTAGPVVLALLRAAGVWLCEPG